MNLQKSCVVLLGLGVGCSPGPETLQKNLEAPLALVSAKTVESPEDLGRVVDDCLTRGDRRLPRAYVGVHIPVLNLATRAFEKESFTFTLHEKTPSSETFELAFLIGHVIVTSPNDASLDLMEHFSDRTNRWVQKAHQTPWRVGWRTSRGLPDTWETNAVMLHIANGRYAASPLEWLNYTQEVIIPNDGDINTTVIHMVISRSIVDFFLPDFAGRVTFVPRVVGLAQKHKLVACVPAQVAETKE